MFDNNTCKIVADPWECEACSPCDREAMGCGYEGHAGKGPERPHGPKDETWRLTCPQYCAGQPWVQQVFQATRHYRHQALGCVLDLEAPLVDLIEACLDEHDSWEAELQRALGDHQKAMSENHR